MIAAIRQEELFMLAAICLLSAHKTFRHMNLHKQSYIVLGLQGKALIMTIKFLRHRLVITNMHLAIQKLTSMPPVVS